MFEFHRYVQYRHAWLQCWLMVPFSVWEMAIYLHVMLFLWVMLLLWMMLSSQGYFNLSWGVKHSMSLHPPPLLLLMLNIVSLKYLYWTWELMLSMQVGDSCSDSPAKGKAACTKFTRISTNGTHSIVLCKPITGRTHQVRVYGYHCFRIG